MADRKLRPILDEMPEKVDLQNAAKIYIEGISRIHAGAGKVFETALANSHSRIEEAIDSYRKASSGKTIGLFAIQLDGDEIIERVPLLLEWDDIRVRLSQRNPELVNLTIRHVSGRARRHSD
jgi:hypothetical protein